MKNPFSKFIRVNHEENLANKLKLYQRMKSHPALAKKTFKDLLDTFIEGYRAIRKSKKSS